LIKWSKKNKGITPEVIQELFPNDKELYDKIMQIKSQAAEKSKINTDESKLHTLQNKKSTPSEKTIQRKLEEFKAKLNEELSKIINEEKEKENERNQKHDNETDPEKKKKLETLISQERAQSSQKILTWTNGVDEKVRAYELKLRDGTVA